MSPPAETSRVHHPFLVLLALGMGGFAIGTTEFASMSLLPFMSKGLGVDEPTAGHVISAYALGVVFGAPIIAVLASRLPRRTLLIGLMAIFAVGNGLSAIAPDIETMLVFRFFSGMPHGAYFGVAALMAASLVPPNKRSQAVARVMLGLTIATIIGVPAATWLGQGFGWRWGFAVVSVLAVLTGLLVALFAPAQPPAQGTSPLRELGALGNRQVWLTLGIGAIGFGGVFCVYTYLASTLIEVTHIAPEAIAPVFAVFGIGMTVGTLVCAWAADKALMPTAVGALIWSAVSLALFPAAASSIWTVLPVIFLIGCGTGLGPVLQIRLMDVAGEAQTLAAALHHSAFNFGNALGPWLGGMAIAAGLGWTSTGYVGAGLALGGLIICLIAIADYNRNFAGTQGRQNGQPLPDPAE